MGEGMGASAEDISLCRTRGQVALDGGYLNLGPGPLTGGCLSPCRGQLLLRVSLINLDLARASLVGRIRCVLAPWGGSAADLLTWPPWHGQAWATDLWFSG